MRRFTARKKAIALATAMVFTVATVGTAVAATSSPSLKVAVVDDGVVIASLRAFDPNTSIDIEATVNGGSGTTSLTTNSQGRAVAAFSAPEDFEGKVTVTATSGDITKTATATVGAADDVTMTTKAGSAPTTKVKGSTSTTTAKTDDDEGTTPTSKVRATTVSTASSGRGKLDSGRSGLAWASGAWVTGGGDASDTEFGTYRGRPIDVGLYFPARNSWGDLSELGEVTGKNWAAIISLPAYAYDGSNYSGCASGSYNSQWKTIANNLRSKGFDEPGKTVIRLSWEFNIPGHTPAPDNELFKKCWVNIHNVVNGIAPNILFDWNPNKGGNQVGSAPVEDYWPGDEYVDIVGLDSYDGYGSHDEQLNGKYGLQYWLDFAVKHGKKFSVPEWGPYTGSAWAGNNNGDNAAYMEMMYKFFSDNAANIAYESEFNEGMDYCHCNVVPTGTNPIASATYKKLWGGGA